MWLLFMKAHMNRRDRVSKASFLLVESVKRSVSQAVQELARTGKLKLDKREIPGLVFVMTSMVESGYHAGYKDFMKTIDQVLAEPAEPTMSKRDKIKKILGMNTEK